MSAPERRRGWARAIAPAKVNLTLEVHGRRADGFHELSTTILALDLADTVEARRVPGADGRVELAVSGPAASDDVPADERNLVHRAATAVLAGLRDRGIVREGGVALSLEKRIPSEAGLGGGSADAAAAVVAVEAALGVDLGSEWRRRTLAALGSDCVFFLEAAMTGSALCEGRGERVRPIAHPPPDWWIGVVVPGLRCSTSDVYAALEFPLSRMRQAPTVPEVLFDTSAERARACLFNDLEAAALAAVPELVRWREALDAAGAAHFRLSGSGSGFFGLFPGAAEAEVSLGEIEREAGRRQLTARGEWVTRPAGHGSQLDS